VDPGFRWAAGFEGSGLQMGGGLQRVDSRDPGFRWAAGMGFAGQ